MCKDNTPKLVFYPEWAEAISNEADPARKLQLYEAIMNYAFKGEDPTDVNIKFSLFLIKKRIDADREKWEDVKAKRSMAGRKGGTVSGERRSRKVKEEEAEKKENEEVLQKEEKQPEQKQDEKKETQENTPPKAPAVVQTGGQIALPEYACNVRPNNRIPIEAFTDWYNNTTDTWKESCAMKLSVKLDKLGELFEAFRLEQVCKGVIDKDEKDMYGHFLNYGRIHLGYEEKQNNKRNGNRINTGKDERDAEFREHIEEKLATPEDTAMELANLEPFW